MPDTDKKPEPKKKKKKHKGRELVECLLVAAALALTIRTFGFQIFKIPTRSMEPTLYGNEHYGDRVVAMMWYKRGGVLPLRLGDIQRWQVIVFNHHDDRGKATNYIKRVVGFPGERVEIRDGDVWIWREVDGKVEGGIARKPRELQEQLWIKLGDLDFSGDWRLPHYWEHTPEDAAAVKDGKLLVASAPGKPALLRWISKRDIDNRFIRSTVKRLSPGETPCGHGFRAVFDTSRPMAFCPQCHRAVYGVTDDGYPGEVRTADGTVRVLEVARTTEAGLPIGDFWAVEAMGGRGGKGDQVGDLRLALDFQHLAGKGALEVTLTSRSERFSFRLPLGGSGSLAQLIGPRGLNKSQEVALGPGGKSHHLEVINVDAEFRAVLDGVEIGPCEYAPAFLPDRYASDVEISVSGGARLALDNLRLYRDIYYGCVTIGPMRPGTADGRGGDGGGKICSVVLNKAKGHYFFLGDNSLASRDSRYFESFKTEEDIVARGLLVGWPPSRAHWIK